MDEQLNEKIEQEIQEKKPLDRRTCVRDLRKAYKNEWPGVWVMYAFGVLVTVGVAVLLFWWPYWFLHLLGVLWIAMNWYLGMGEGFRHLLTLCGVCNVALDVMCGSEEKEDENGHKYYYFYFSHHDSKLVTKWMYENILPGEIMYVTTVPGVLKKPIAIYRTQEYEWVGKPDELKDYTTRYAAQGQTEERVENTILARRPLTRGRKWKLTDEAIVRDLLENRVLTSERLAVSVVGIVLLSGLFFLVNATVASVILAVGGAIAVLLIVQYLWYGRQIKQRRFIIAKDTLMDKDPVKRGIGKNRKTRYVLGFRKHRPYILPAQDESIYRDAELGDTFYVVLFEGKTKSVRAVYNALDVEYRE
ncbi:MAG: hypothetical protein IJW40_03460 [Clostridia bacterium]|nr:hypothetical protein [Clostridia bacterium]